MTDFIVRIRSNKLILYCEDILIAIFGKLILCNRNGRLARIVSRLTRDFRSNRITWCSNRVWEVTFNEIIYLSSNFNSVVTFHIIVVNSKLIGVDLFKDCYSIE